MLTNETGQNIVQKQSNNATEDAGEKKQENKPPENIAMETPAAAGISDPNSATIRNIPRNNVKEEIPKPTVILNHIALTLNLVYIFFGAVAVGVGTWISLTKALAGEGFFGIQIYFCLSILTIVLGFSLIITSIMGCLAVSYHSELLSVMYLVFFYLCIILFLIEGIGALALRNRVKIAFGHTLEIGVLYYGIDAYYTKLWDSIQKNFQCCGYQIAVDQDVILGHSIWNYRNPERFTKIKFPESCCKTNGEVKVNVTLCQKEASPKMANIGKECFVPVTDKIHIYAGALGGLGLLTSIFLLLGSATFHMFFWKLWKTSEKKTL